MSRFVSADEADYASLQEQLLHRCGNDDGADQMRASVSGPVDSRSSSASLRSTRASSSQAASATASPSLVLTESSPLLHSTGMDGRSSAMRHASLSSQEVPVMRKLGTWDGVFMPVTLNVLGIILFLRFGFILGQAGLIGALALLVGSYAIDTLTVLSLNAISTNGQVRGGGAYYLISRSLGPEFGGSIGLVFFIGQAFNTAMNTLGCVEILVNAFGESRGYMTFMPEGSQFLYLYGTITLWLCTLV